MAIDRRDMLFAGAGVGVGASAAALLGQQEARAQSIGYTVPDVGDGAAVASAVAGPAALGRMPSGAIGDGQADDTAALRAWIGAAISGIRQMGRERYGSVVLRLPPGRFRVTGGLMPGGFPKCNGFRIEGAGEQLSTIVLDARGATLFENDNGFLIASISDIGFVSTDDSNVFMASHSSPPAGANQGWSFDRVNWGGRWGRGFVLTGTNNNSEWRFTGGGVSGRMGDFIYIPGDATASDQFVNFWFEQFKFWPTDRIGNCMINFGRGGHVKIANCDFSGLQAGVLFKLTGSAHARGVCHFVCQNSRFELKSPAISVMQCGWGQGLVAFRDNDFSSQLSAYPPETVAFSFVDAAANGPAVVFEGNDLIGSIAFRSSAGTTPYKTITAFRDNSFLSHPDLFAAFLIDTGGVPASRRTIVIENNRGAQGSTTAGGGRVHVTDCILGAADAAYASGMTRRFASLPGGGGTQRAIVLPPGVMIVDARLSPANGGGQGMLLRTQGGTLLARMEAGATSASFRGAPIRTGSDLASRSVWLVPPPGGQVPPGDYLVEYIG